jgi:hypothetical protein
MEHHVYFWLKEEFKTAAARAEFEAGLDSLFKIPTVAGGFWGTPAPVMPRPVIDSSWDYATSMRFDSVAKQDTYQDDPDHHAFIERFQERWAKVLVMDVQAP